VSVLAPGMSTMPLRSGFVWDEAADCFKYDPFLRQVREWGKFCHAATYVLRLLHQGAARAAAAAVRAGLYA
jgi:hypothetical protein